MKRKALIGLFTLFLFLLAAGPLAAQCSICTKTAQQLGEKPAEGMNSGILYLAFTPFLIIGYIAYRWFRNNRAA